MNCRRNLEERILQLLNDSDREVFIRKDFEGLAGYDQVGRVLSSLILKGKLIRIGYGLYAKAMIAPISKRSIPRIGIRLLATEVLNRLYKIPTFPSSFEQSYNRQETTQVPTGRVIGVKERVTRKIGYDGKYITFELIQ
jgi:hypothetical protein